LSPLKRFLSGLLIQRLEGEPDPGAHQQVRLILPAIDSADLSNLDAALARLPEPYKFEFTMIRSGLAACCVYVSYGGIQIRPIIPPTYENHVFARAKQRIYLSATLGSGGELERAFGRPEIVRMPLLTCRSNSTTFPVRRRPASGIRPLAVDHGQVVPRGRLAGPSSTSRRIGSTCYLTGLEEIRTRAALTLIAPPGTGESTC
jgi:hypothetical protein